MNNDALNDNAHRDDVTKALSGLFGQWIEGINVDRYGQISGLITSRGWVIRASIEVPGLGPVEMDDSRIGGPVIVNVEVLPTGSLTLVCVYLRKEGDVRFHASAPWAISGEKGFAIAARPDGQIGIRPSGEPHFATPAKLLALRESQPSVIEIDVLDRAEADWVEPGDVVSSLLEHGVKDNQEITEQGIAALSALVARGELEMGVIGDNGFEVSQRGIEDDIEHIERTWRALSPRKPYFGQIGWFNLTDAGRSRLLKAKRAPSGDGA